MVQVARGGSGGCGGLMLLSGGRARERRHALASGDLRPVGRKHDMASG